MAPRHHTARTPGSATHGPGIAKVAELLGTPLMPWQRRAADVIGEVDEHGRYRHSTVVLSVPRQAGKSALMDAVAVHRALTLRGARIWQTQQTGQDAREAWRKLVDDRFVESILRPLAVPARSAGSEALRFPSMRTQIRPHPPTMASLHGEQSDLNIIDEAWAFDPAQGRDLLQAIVPTQATRPGAQTVIVSTRGTATGSTWFHDIVDKAITAESSAAIIDYGIPPAVEATVDTVVAHHPAVGHTINVETVAKALDALGPSQFARAYGNRSTATASTLIPAHRLAAATWTDARPGGVRWHYAAAVAEDRSDAAIAAAAMVDGVPLAAIVQHATGTAWVADRLAELVESWDSPAPSVDRIGPAGTVAEDLDRLGVTTRPLTSRDIQAATGNLLDRIDPADPDADVTVRLVHDTGLWSALDAVALKNVGDAKMLDRRASAGSIACLEAVMLAIAAAVNAAPPPVAPKIWI